MLKILLKKWGVLPVNPLPVPKPNNLPYYLLRLEGLAVLLVALYLYFFILKSSFVLFLVLILVPDLSLFAYAFKTKIGAIIYDLFHTYIVPGILVGIGLLYALPLLVDIGLIWIVHIAQDRMRGFGFKYTDRFEGSHLHKI